MKKMYLFCFSILIIATSCSKDEDPLLEVKLEMSKSDKFQSALVAMGSFSLFEKDSETNQVGTSIIQQWQGVEIDQDLTIDETNIILVEPHWELKLNGVKPGINISVDENGVNKQVEIDYIESITLKEPIVLSKNKDYEIIISIDTDNAIENQGGQFELNWDFVTAEAVEK